ncbi:hypothetical protein [Azohydromonas caseinilytica]|uniref:Uncharacterized protein n=1 Tax=Azohydromonas caseinilytica TaxID=2728836 RepID=A0A848FEX9_9BURK|nr:hypothetical protein [Azohydromonas caseinilytica]NML16823.1 hypothetical protein [Azohydromonas caseinilytica]
MGSRYLQRLIRPPAAAAVPPVQAPAGIEQLAEVEAPVAVGTPPALERALPAALPVPTLAQALAWVSGPGLGAEAPGEATVAPPAGLLQPMGSPSPMPSADWPAPLARAATAAGPGTVPADVPRRAPSAGARASSPAPRRLAPRPEGAAPDAAEAPQARTLADLAAQLPRLLPARSMAEGTAPPAAVPRDAAAGPAPAALPPAQVAVHIGRVALTLQMPPAPPPPAMAPAPAAAAVEPAPARRPLEGLRFSAARHHLRWS